ncbi:aminopeptidase P family protein [Prosthecomicrobium hirschii]|uniref:aminopeptidase P family protein n=1 Tax=Prosthecodimorpha hirschii TaxID=665126 RepID=UPI00221FC83B|nr:aminopeptidase P family protein [Prosthecomicrobium hirschii]MCW1838674.1 aminopeptidase P family protein [Prosthecomicrobium hirschii]
MFQSFEDITDPTVGPVRVAALRAELDRRGLDGFVIPRADEHQNEYVPASADRLRWLTGFTGSAGAAIVLRDRAAILVDGRYTLQAQAQVDMTVFDLVDIVETPVADWLEKNLAPGARLGLDPWLHTIGGMRRLKKAAEKAGAAVVAVDGNPLDAVWADRPAPPLGAVALHPPELAGETAAAKLGRLAGILADRKADAAILSQPDSIAWAFNIRGSDVSHTPLPISYAVLHRDGRPELFIDGRKLGNEVRATLEDIADIAEPAAFPAALAALGAAKAQVLVDPAWTSDAVAGSITAAGGSLVEGEDPVLIPRARKNAAEIAGARAAHLRDAAAYVAYLAWFDREAPKGGLDEIAAVETLEAFRAKTGALKDISFDTISGAGPNGAIVHYRVTRATNRPIERDSVFLLDSGAQYRDGTTDITRTLAVGTPDPEARQRATLVLKGHLAISMARFPKGTTGAQLDTLARIALWQAGLDYDHGTGHGVGSFLSVHEGPHRIAKTGMVALEPGMIVSNEPGYYKTGAYGIRIENLVLVTEPETVPGGERPMLGFETLTLAPYDRRLIDTALLTAAERAWIDRYHERVRAAVGPLVDAETRAWLDAATAPLA